MKFSSACGTKNNCGTHPTADVVDVASDMTICIPVVLDLAVRKVVWADGTVEVGYSLLEEYQGKGYATEAVRSLLAWAFGHPQVGRVIAETYPDLRPSIRVLEKNGFTHTGEGSGEGIIRFALSRSEFDGRQVS